MSWVSLGTVQPSLEWQAVGGADGILIDFDTVLVRVTHAFTSYPKGTAYLRQFFVDENASTSWIPLYPSTEKSILRISVPSELKINGIARWEPQIRLRRFTRVPSSSDWQITLEARVP